MADPAKTGGRMLQSEQATAGDRAQQNRATMMQGQMALSAAAQVTEQFRQQQDFMLKSQESKQRVAMLAVKQQLFQQQVMNAGAVTQLKQQQAQAQMMQAEASKMRAELDSQHLVQQRFKMFGVVRRPDGTMILPDDVRKGTYRMGRASNPEDVAEADRLDQGFKETRTGKDQGPSIASSIGDLMDIKKNPLDTAKDPLDAHLKLARRVGITDEEIRQESFKFLPTDKKVTEEMWKVGQVKAIRSLLLSDKYGYRQ